MDPIERAVSERLGALQDETRWRAASVFLNADAPAARPSRRRWFAWAVPAVVLAAAVAALAAFTLGGVLTLGGKPGPAAPTGINGTAPGVNYCRQLSGSLAPVGNDLLPASTLQKLGASAFLITLVNTSGVACRLPAVPDATWMPHLAHSSTAVVNAGTTTGRETVALPARGKAYAVISGFPGVYCPLTTDPDATKGTLRLDFGEAGSPALLALEISGDLGGCGGNESGVGPALWPFASTRATAVSYVSAGASPPLPVETTTDTAPIAPNGQPANAQWAPCAPKQLVGTVSGGYGTGGLQYWDIGIRNSSEAACMLQGTPRLAVGGETDGASHPVKDPAPYIELAPGTTAYVRMSTPEPGFGTLPCTRAPVASLSLYLPNAAGRLPVPDLTGRVTRCAGEPASFQVWPFSTDKSLGPWGGIPNGVTTCSNGMLHAKVTVVAKNPETNDTRVTIELQNSGASCYMVGQPLVTWIADASRHPIGSYAVESAMAKQRALELPAGGRAALNVWIHDGTTLSRLAGSTSDQCQATTPYGLELQLSPSDAQGFAGVVPFAQLSACLQDVQQLVVEGPFAAEMAG